MVEGEGGRVMAKCEICGKFFKEDEEHCPYYCSYACCLEGMDRMVGNLGGSLEQAEIEIQESCKIEFGGCPY